MKNLQSGTLKPSERMESNLSQRQIKHCRKIVAEFVGQLGIVDFRDPSMIELTNCVQFAIEDIFEKAENDPTVPWFD